MTIDKKLKITMTRHQICDLMLATAAVVQAAEGADNKWIKLHDELEQLLKDYDAVCASNKP